MARKAAIQMSLGFIVAIVFAVILLSLMLAWINSIFPALTDITHKVTETARAELLEKMANNDDKVGIAAPPVTRWNKGETGSYAVGIKNTKPDLTLNTYMNIYLSDVGGELAGRDASEFNDDVDKWLTYTRPPEKEVIEPSDQRTSDIIIRPDPTARTGIYRFTVVVCENPSCVDLDSPGMYGYTRFALDIK